MGGNEEESRGFGGALEAYQKAFSSGIRRRRRPVKKFIPWGKRRGELGVGGRNGPMRGRHLAVSHLGVESGEGQENSPESVSPHLVQGRVVRKCPLEILKRFGKYRNLSSL